MEIIKFKQLLKKYQQGDANRAESYLVDSWYESFAEDTVLRELTTPHEEELLEMRLWHNIKPTKKLQWNSRLLWAAASVLLLIGIGIGLYPYDHQGQISKPVEKRQVFVSGERQIKEIQLPDSTQVWLNARSSLELLPKYKRPDRKVKLSGEAYLEIKADADHPFYVLVDSLEISVLGTTFNVNVYPDGSTIRVTVGQGSVRIYLRKQPIATLSAHQQLTYDRKEGKYEVKQLPDFKTDSWKEGRVFLEKANFEELAQAIRNLYGVELRTESKEVRAYKYDIVLQSKQSLDDLMEIVAFMLNKKYKKEGTDVIIK